MRSLAKRLQSAVRSLAKRLQSAVRSLPKRVESAERSLPKRVESAERSLPKRVESAVRSLVKRVESAVRSLAKRVESAEQSQRRRNTTECLFKACSAHVCRSMYVQLRQFADQHRIRTHKANYSELAKRSRLERAHARAPTAQVVQSVVMLHTFEPPSPPCPIDVDADFVVVPCHETGIQRAAVEVVAEDEDEEYEMIDQLSACAE